VAPAGGVFDRVLEAVVVDGGVDRGSADVGVSGELADASIATPASARCVQNVWRSTWGERRSAAARRPRRSA